MRQENDTYNVIIAGSRTFGDYGRLREACDAILRDVAAAGTVTVLSGAAAGADTLGERYAAERGIAVRRFPADWQRHGRAAGPIRNSQMAGEGHMLIAFWDGKSRGTAHMISMARKRGLAVHVISCTR